ncbi:unnamed protein product [Eruca vesicaria subsp. sativa]|uniref:BHLH domain-containing protein n=1 Tax=Eruca vesicaria subsp. sativa TaxID=29727 RepID=A0ABC8KZR0_ERUVS|nr:unnamed protein product [Eruca vesicaria subsp. sativa]
MKQFQRESTRATTLSIGDNHSKEFHDLHVQKTYGMVHRQTSLGVTVSSEVNGIDNNSVVIKKLIHNANERDRRKKTNSVFSALRSCLPGSDTSSEYVSYQ